MVYKIFIIIAMLFLLSSCGSSKKATEMVFKGNSFADAGKYNEAIECYDKAIEIDSRCKDAWNNKGNLLADQKKYSEAHKCYDEALKIDPKYVSALYNKATVLMDEGKYDVARKYLEKVLHINPDHDGAKQLLGK